MTVDIISRLVNHKVLGVSGNLNDQTYMIPGNLTISGNLVFSGTGGAEGGSSFNTSGAAITYAGSFIGGIGSFVGSLYSPVISDHPHQDVNTTATPEFSKMTLSHAAGAIIKTNNTGLTGIAGGAGADVRSGAYITSTGVEFSVPGNKGVTRLVGGSVNTVAGDGEVRLETAETQRVIIQHDGTINFKGNIISGISATLTGSLYGQIGSFAENVSADFYLGDAGSLTNLPEGGSSLNVSGANINYAGSFIGGIGSFVGSIYGTIVDMNPLYQTDFVGSHITLEHNLGREYPSVTVYTDAGQIIEPETIFTSGVNNTVFTLGSQISGTAVVMGGVGMSTGIASFTNTTFVPRDADGTSFDWDETTLTADNTWRDLDFSSIVPAGTIAVMCRVQVKDATSDSRLAIRKNGFSDVYEVGQSRTQVANIWSAAIYPTIAIDGDLKGEYRINEAVTNAGIYVMGWWVAESVSVKVGDISADVDMQGYELTDTPMISAAKSHLSASQTGVATGTWTMLELDTSVFDINSEMTGSRFTAKADGYYQVNGVVQIDDVNDGNYVQGAIYKNGTDVANVLIRASAAGQILLAPISDIVQLDSGGYVELWCRHNEGNDQVATGGDEFANYMSVGRIA